jgi:hypothetical protein
MDIPAAARTPWSAERSDGLPAAALRGAASGGTGGSGPSSRYFATGSVPDRTVRAPWGDPAPGTRLAGPDGPTPGQARDFWLGARGVTATCGETRDLPGEGRTGTMRHLSARAVRPPRKRLTPLVLTLRAHGPSPRRWPLALVHPARLKSASRSGGRVVEGARLESV